MQVPFLDLQTQFAQIKSEIMAAIEEVCDGQMVCLGPAVKKFESEIARYVGVKHAIGVSSGSDALLAALMSLDISAGDEVITTPFTFFATAGAISRTGATPVFADIDPDDYNIDPTQIEAKITDKTKAIIPVHLYGQVAKMEAIMDLAKKYDLAVVEDACQSIGASRNGTNAGAFGDMGCFSFYPTKNLGAFGDAGLVTTNDDQLAEKLRFCRDHGQNPRYYYQFVGGNFRLDSIQGAVLSVKLNYLDKWNSRRQENAQVYKELLADCPVKLPVVDEGNDHIYHQFTIATEKRDQLQKFLADKGVASAIFYPKPLHIQDCFASLGHKEGDFPVSEAASQKVLCLPIAPELELEQIKYAAASVKEFFGN